MALIRILSWNILQGGGSRIDNIMEAIKRHHPDILSLQEYRENPEFIDQLHHQGLTSFFAPEAASANQNRPAVAARWPFEIEQVFPDDQDQQPRVVEACFQAPDSPFDLKLFNVHLPHKKEQIPVFNYLLDQQHSLSQPAVMIGDFNCGIPFEDSETKSFDNTRQFQQLLNQGWVDAWRQRNLEAKEFSWISAKKKNGYRYDNALVSNSIDQAIKRIEYDHTMRLEKTSDHSALFLDIEVQPSMSGLL